MGPSFSDNRHEDFQEKGERVVNNFFLQKFCHVHCDHEAFLCPICQDVSLVNSPCISSDISTPNKRG